MTRLSALQFQGQGRQLIRLAAGAGMLLTAACASTVPPAPAISLEQQKQLLELEHQALSQQLEALKQAQQTLHIPPETVEKVRPSIVSIQTPQGPASGVFIQDAAGQVFILSTNEALWNTSLPFKIQRLLQGLRSGKVSALPTDPDTFTVQAGRDGSLQSLTARVHVRDIPKNLALLRLTTPFEPTSAVNPQQFRDLSTDPLVVGEPVFFIPPGGTANTREAGIISHPSRYSARVPGHHLLQADPACRPTHLGGPLFDRQGRLLGLHALQVKDIEGRPAAGLCLYIRGNSLQEWLTSQRFNSGTRFA